MAGAVGDKTLANTFGTDFPVSAYFTLNNGHESNQQDAYRMHFNFSIIFGEFWVTIERRRNTFKRNNCKYDLKYLNQGRLLDNKCTLVNTSTPIHFINSEVFALIIRARRNRS